jgi:hypothetical protein
MDYKSKEQFINEKKKKKNINQPISILKRTSSNFNIEEEQQHQSCLPKKPTGKTFKKQIIKKQEEGNKDIQMKIIDSCIENTQKQIKTGNYYNQTTNCFFKDSYFNCEEGTKVNVCAECFALVFKGRMDCYYRPNYSISLDCLICNLSQDKYNAFGSIHLCKQHKDEFTFD